MKLTQPDQSNVALTADSTSRLGEMFHFDVSDADLLVVRHLLAAIMQTLDHLCYSRVEKKNDVELVLAEVLTNIVEHGYDAHTAAPIKIAVMVSEKSVIFDIRDHGRQMPGLRPPDQKLPNISGPIETIPEGGFGWFLIHALTQTLLYDRIDGENRLQFEISV